MRFPLLFAIAVLGCSSAEESPKATGADPIPQTLPPATPEFATVGSIEITSNAGLERIVDVSFRKARASTCTFELAGGCLIGTCPSATTPVANEPVDPGTITVSSPSIGENVVVMLTGGESRIVQPGPFAAGETVRVQGTGAEAPAFDLNVTLPTAPATWSFAGCAAKAEKCTVDGSNSTATWTASTGQASILFSLETATRDKWAASCRYDAAAGSGRIPAEVFAKMPRGGSGRATLSISASAIAASGTHRTTLRAAVLPTDWVIYLTTK